MAQTPFAGTWIVQPELTRFALRSPSFLLERGVFERTSCAAALRVPADGMEHPVSGDPNFEAVLIRALDRRHVEMQERRSDKVIWQGRYAVSRDGKSMTLAYEDRRATAVVTGSMQFARDGAIIAHAHLMSGTWLPVKLTQLSPSGSRLTIRDIENGLSMEGSDGRVSDTKFDRQYYPLLGYLEGATVLVGRPGERLLQINRALNGLVVEVSRGSVSDDGSTMTLKQLDRQCQSEVVYTLTKQSP